MLDFLELREWCPEREIYSGRRIIAQVSYLLMGSGEFGIEVGHVVMSLAQVSKVFHDQGCLCSSCPEVEMGE